MTLAPYISNGNFAYVNGFPVFDEGLNVIILQITVTTAIRAFWQALSLDACLGSEARESR